MTSSRKPGLPQAKLRVMMPGGDWIGPGKADLLEGIEATGSISAAGKRMRMSYKRAWGLVETLNRMFSEPLVSASRGGAGHGGAELTATGREVLALYRQMQHRTENALSQEIAALSRLTDIPAEK